MAIWTIAVGLCQCDHDPTIRGFGRNGCSTPDRFGLPDCARRTAMSISDDSGGARVHFDAFPENGGVARRSLLVGGAALLVGAGLMKPAPAFAAGSTGEASQTMGNEPFGPSPAQQVGQLVILSYARLTPPQA